MPFTEGRLEWGKGMRGEERVRERSGEKELACPELVEGGPDGPSLRASPGPRHLLFCSPQVQSERAHDAL
jgi:hypothetical protein